MGFWARVKATIAQLRRPGVETVDTSLARTYRDATGPFGPVWYRGKRAQAVLDTVAESHENYQKSFNRHLPPSTFVSERDRVRLNQAMPLPERAIEDTAAQQRMAKDLKHLDEWVEGRAGKVDGVG